MSWWSNLFGGEKKATAAMPAVAARPPSYKELVERIGALEDQIADERNATAEKRQRIASRSRDDQALLSRYRDALEFYASEQSWRPVGLVSKVAAHEDRGYKARKALGRL